MVAAEHSEIVHTKARAQREPFVPETPLSAAEHPESWVLGHAWAAAGAAYQTQVRRAAAAAELLIAEARPGLSGTELGHHLLTVGRNYRFRTEAPDRVYDLVLSDAPAFRGEAMYDSALPVGERQNAIDSIAASSGLKVVSCSQTVAAPNAAIYCFHNADIFDWNAKQLGELASEGTLLVPTTVYPFSSLKRRHHYVPGFHLADVLDALADNLVAVAERLRGPAELQCADLLDRKHRQVLAKLAHFAWTLSNLGPYRDRAQSSAVEQGLFPGQWGALYQVLARLLALAECPPQSSEGLDMLLQYLSRPTDAETMFAAWLTTGPAPSPLVSAIHTDYEASAALLRYPDCSRPDLPNPLRAMHCPAR